MSAIDKLQFIQNILNVVVKVVTIADKVIDYIVEQIQTKGA